MLADIAIGNVEKELDAWRTTGRAPSLKSWANTQEELAYAKRLNSNDPNYFQLQGLLHEWRFFLADAPYSNDEGFSFRQQAITAYRTAITLRPAWPEGWAHLARQKAIAGQVDEEFDLAIERATTLGHWEMLVHLLITETGLMAWPSLSPISRTAVIANLERGLSLPRTDRLLLNFLQGHESFPELLCPLLDQSKLTTQAQTACGI